MSDLVEQMVVSVRADTTAFARDVASMRGELEGPLASGAGRAALTIERALGRAIKTGKFGFKELANSIISDLMRIGLQRNLVKPLENWLFGSAGGGLADRIGRPEEAG